MSLNHTVFIVEDIQNSPGKLYAIIENYEDAVAFAQAVTQEFNSSCSVTERTVFTGQPPVLGVNR